MNSIRTLICFLGLLAVVSGCVHKRDQSTAWEIVSHEDWQRSVAESEGVEITDGLLSPIGKTGSYRSQLNRFSDLQTLESLTISQSSVWQNWTAVDKVAPSNLQDAPVFLALGSQNYWIFGRYGKPEVTGFVGADVELEGFDIPLKTTPFPKQYDAPGGLKPSMDGYHAWQSRDMIHWVHHGPVSDRRARWVTTAEYVNGKTYIYYDFPNDQDPHLLIDNDLTDGMPGTDMGMVFKDPSDGSDIAIIRDESGQFHLIYEDWSPVHAGAHSWDSPLAGHAVSADGMGDFKILDPVIDERTQPTGVFKEYAHPHWYRDDPANYQGKPTKKGEFRAFARYEVHEPEQNAYGDWASIKIGGQYYLFGDFHPAGTKLRSEMQIAWFTATNIDGPFEPCGSIGSGHPDPDIGFAEGRFYLINQTNNDYVSPGPWVESVEVRVGVDTTNDGQVDVWSGWQSVRETYDYVEGFAKQISRAPASIETSQLPKGYGFCFELRIEDQTENSSKPVLDSVRLSFN
ncbi:MAG TPA: hypothetical protein DCX06_04055 [Opitutae bacterium]|nr:hypothetical protein [Opitutae bacterium]